MTQRHVAIVAFAIIGLFGLTGCNEYKANFAQSYQMGNYAAAQVEVEQEGGRAMKDPSNGDHLIYLLEQGAIQRTAGQLEPSNQTLDAADKAFAAYDAKPYVRVGREAYAAVTNLSELAYEGYGYDRIMMNAYKALNYMEQGNLDFARAELKRVAYVQQKVQQHKDERIKEAEAARRENGGDSYDVNRAMSDPGFRTQSQAVYGDLPDNKARAVYVNAFAEYLQGIFLLHDGDPADLEIGRAAMKRTVSMVDNEYARQDLAMAEQMSSGQRVSPVTYVIFETGMAPKREEIRIDIPIFLYNIVVHDTGVDYVGAAFPKLVTIPGGLPSVVARTSGGTYPTQMLVDMDAVVGKEFRDELPAVITRTLIAAGTKAALAYAANRATQSQNNGWINLITRVATTAYQFALNQADLRTWRTLPKMIVICRFPTPTDGNVSLTSPSGMGVVNARVDPNSSNIIWVRGPSDFGPFASRTFVLGKPGTPPTTAPK